MARRFRRLRRAAHQVIEVTRRFCRLCQCCGTVRTETSRDVIPVSVVLSCTNLPTARTSFFSWHWCTRNSTHESGAVSQISESPFIGPQNWIRATNSGVPSDQSFSSQTTDRHGVCNPYMPGSFAREYPFTLSGTNSKTDDHDVCQGARTFPRPLQTKPIWSISASSQTDDHVPLRFLLESQTPQGPMSSERNVPGNWGSSNAEDVCTPSSCRMSMDRSLGVKNQTNASQVTGLPKPKDSPKLNTSTHSLAVVDVPSGIPCPRRTQLQIFDNNYRHLGSDSNLVLNSSLSSRSNRLVPKSELSGVVPSVFSINLRDPLGSPPGKSCEDRPVRYSRCYQTVNPRHSGAVVMSPNASSFMGRQRLISSNNLFSSNNDYRIASVSNIRLVRNANNQSAVIMSSTNVGPSAVHPLQGCSKTDPHLRLNLELLKDSSASLAAFSSLKVEFAIRSEWNEIDPANWHQRRIIARTKCGTVEEAYCDKFGKKFALKTLSSVSGDTEAEILRQCQGPFVVEMHAVLSEGDEKLLCTSFYERLDLAYWLQKDDRRDHFTEAEAALICSYVLTGLEFIHNTGILHLDIKPGNIFICSKGYPVIGDFGSARNVNNNTEALRHFTPAYASPEVLSGEIPTTQADLWSTACVYYEIVSGRSPYQGKYAAMSELKLIVGSTPDVSMLSIDGQHYICAQFESDKTNRLGFSFGAREVMRHRVYHSINWDEVKYGHRHSESQLAAVLRSLDKPDEERSQSSSSSVSNNNNNSSTRWELWSSSSSSDESDDEFGFSARALSTVEEEGEEYGELERPQPDDGREEKVRFNDSGG